MVLAVLVLMLQSAVLQLSLALANATPTRGELPRYIDKPIWQLYWAKHGLATCEFGKKIEKRKREISIGWWIPKLYMRNDLEISGTGHIHSTEKYD
ncbi:hypothetical protein CS371_21380 [Serratia marcescens]|nr:hypothetical protein CS371_21380 [Serratia marcescens]